MFYSGGFLNAVVDGCASTTSPNDDEYSYKRKSTTSGNTSDDNIDDGNLSNRQRQKLKRKLKKQEAIKLKRQLEASSSCNNDISQSCPSPSSHQPIRLHQFIGIVFRSELNIAENGGGYFIQNAPKVSAHHAILNGVVRVNGVVTKAGSKILEFGDVVSLEIDTSSLSEATASLKLVSWKGSEDAAKKLEGQRDNVERKGRMTISQASPDEVIDANAIPILPFIKYYRTKLGRLWVPSIHETALKKPLPMTLRVLKDSKHLEHELRRFGFRPVSIPDVCFQLCPTSNVTEGDDGDATRQQHHTSSIDPNIMKEFMWNTWIMDQAQLSTVERERQLGVFLSDARICGEILQQELNSMMPVSILVAILKKKMLNVQSCGSSPMSTARPLRFLDLCAAPGSKTCQLIAALDTILIDDDRDEEQKRYNDFVIVANELNPSRAMQLRQRCFQQCGSRALSHLIVTNADGRDFENVEKSSFDLVICDVPCSGDGTIRRSPDLLYKWSTKNAEKNKPIQKGLLKVALERLRPGGTCVYSTCSLNPVENDEVVEETLDELNNINNNEYSLLNLERISRGSCGGYLRILPAASHGGFFVVAIRRKESEVGDKSSKIMSHGECSVEMVWKNKEANKPSVAYAISPCTRQLSANISERLDSPISSGVPVMYKAKDESAPIILQEGCAALTALRHGLVSVVQLSRLELGKCARQADGRTLCIQKTLFTHITDETTALIITLAETNLLVPAKILFKQKLSGGTGKIDDDDDDDVSYAAVEIIARPQILKRCICA